MSDIRTAYGSKTTLVTTNFTSLANNSAWQSATMDFSSTLYLDAIIRIQTKGQASGTATVDFYIAASINADTTYPDSATGTEGTFTAANRLNATYLDSITMNTTSAVIRTLRSIASVLGYLPQKCALIGINKSGAAVSTTAGDHIFEFQPIYMTTA